MSPPPVIKREHDVLADSDDEVFEVHVAKARETSTNAGRPKAADYEVAAREVILSAANTYRALLASKGAFPTSSEELDLVKQSWKRVNDDSGMSPMALTPDIVRIVSYFILILLSLFFFALTVTNTFSRSRLEALRPAVRRKPRPLHSLRLYTDLTVGEARRPLPKIVKRQKN
jgi:hypothetical protein